MKELLAGVVLNLSAYCYSGVTASGTYTHPGTVAAAPSIPFGTRVQIEGLPGVYTVEDRGAAITEGHLDVYVMSCREAIEFGRQSRLVWVVTEEGE